MKYYIGIDLGTTNSVICRYDGTEAKPLKSPEQNDVTPSALYFDRRGNKYVGRTAYDKAPFDPDNAAILFKRFMGSNTPMRFPSQNLTMTPEQCSAEVLKVLFGYLPEEIRNSGETGTVITVPAAFNQMQKNATIEAAALAGIGQVALMQEPVAAIMSVMRSGGGKGIFLIFDLGGGTLDIAIAENIENRVNLLAHGGIQVCGGRDFDRRIVDGVVRPWLRDNFKLPEDWAGQPKYRHLNPVIGWAVERAKIELSSKDASVISLLESDARATDLDGKEIYLDIPLSRGVMEQLISPQLDEAVEAARSTLAQTGYSPHDLTHVVFIGGPTHYQPLREKVCLELGLKGFIDVNPMTAVADGASIFAESIDWSTREHSRKSDRGQLSLEKANLGLAFKFDQRTPASKARIAALLEDPAQPGTEFQVDSLDTGWTSGRRPLENGAIIEAALAKMGENTFKVFVFDRFGGPMALPQDRIVITRTVASIDAIPASSTVSVEALEKLGGAPTLVHLARKGDTLPKKGKVTFKAAETLKAGDPGSLNFKLWEGGIEDPINFNRLIGVAKLSARQIHAGVIPAGAELICDYDIRESGQIILEISVPRLGITILLVTNFYSRQEGQLDFTGAAKLVINLGRETVARFPKFGDIDDPRLGQARGYLDSAILLDTDERDPEKVQAALEDVLKARNLMATVRREWLKVIRNNELQDAVSDFEARARQYASATEAADFDSLVKLARRSIELNDKDFEIHLAGLNNKTFQIKWRQDWYVVELFRWIEGKDGSEFTDIQLFERLLASAEALVAKGDFAELRKVVNRIFGLMRSAFSEQDLLVSANIVKV